MMRAEGSSDLVLGSSRSAYGSLVTHLVSHPRAPSLVTLLPLGCASRPLRGVVNEMRVNERN